MTNLKDKFEGQTYRLLLAVQHVLAAVYDIKYKTDKPSVTKRFPIYLFCGENTTTRADRYL
jgi:hypothetical protein